MENDFIEEADFMASVWNLSAEGVFCLQAGRVFHHSHDVRAVAAMKTKTERSPP